MDQQAPVLVVVLNDPTDLARARDAHWYRIPQRSAPRRTAAEYLAFYQTAAFPPEERWQIRWIAPVRGYYLASRKELIPEEPSHPRADDLYYKVVLGPVTALQHPIRSRRLRRITFIATTAGRLCRAQEINDLWIRTDPQERLWTALQEAELEAECRYPVADGDEEHSIDFALLCRDGRVAVMVGPAPDAAQLNETTDLAPAYLLVAHGWTTMRLSVADIQQDASGWAARLAELCATLGGVV
jgi:very-short-patch-repair endonuclease